MAEEGKASFTVGNGDELDDWEAMDDSGVLDKQMDELRSRVQKEEPVSDQQTLNDKPCLEFGKVTILKNTNEQRTQHPGRTVKILKRPPEEIRAMAESMGERKPSVKSLEEREKDYQEARKRILGKEVENNQIDVSSTSSGSESSPRSSQKSGTVTVSNSYLTETPKNSSTNNFKQKQNTPT